MTDKKRLHVQSPNDMAMEFLGTPRYNVFIGGRSNILPLGQDPRPPWIRLRPGAYHRVTYQQVDGMYRSHNSDR